MSDGFDLRSEPWVLVRAEGGASREVSLRDALVEAGFIAGLAGELPTQQLSVLRLLLAVVHRALDTADEEPTDRWQEIWSAGRLPPEPIEAYLASYGDRFDLFHPRTPFFQVADLRTAKNEVFGLERIVADVPSGHRFFTTRAGESLDAMTPAEAARWVVHCQAYDPSGIKSGAIGDDRVKGGKGYPIGSGFAGQLGAVVPEGITLFETVMLNWVPVDLRERPDPDLPPWERPRDGPAQRANAVPTGVVDLLTWQSRRIRLQRAEDRVTGVLIANGDRLHPRDHQDAETMSGWRRSENQEKQLEGRGPERPVYMPTTHNPDRTVWRGLASLLAETSPAAVRGPDAHKPAPVLGFLAQLDHDGVLPSDQRLRIRTVGMVYGSNSSVVDGIVDDALLLRLAVVGRPELRRAAVDAVDETWRAVRLLADLASDLAVASGGDAAPPRDRVVEDAYVHLDPWFRRWLTTLGADVPAQGQPAEDAMTLGEHVEARRAAWQRALLRVLRDLGRQVVLDRGDPAWTGRYSGDRLLDAGAAEGRFLGRLSALLTVATPTSIVRGTEQEAS